MIKNNNKTKYALQAIFVAIFFILFNSSAQASEITPDNIIKYVNLAREAQGIEIVIPNEKLMQVAKDKLNDMIANDYFAHTSPAGTEPWDWFKKENYNYHYAGENLAINFKTAEKQQEAWMKSPLHRKNILDDKYQEIGVAVGEQKVDGKISIVAVQEFGTTFEGIAISEKSFSHAKDKDVIKENGRIAPQVLSVKDSAPEKIIKPEIVNDFEKNYSTSFGDKNAEMIFQGLIVAITFVMISILLMTIALLAISMDKTWAILERSKEKMKMAF